MGHSWLPAGPELSLLVGWVNKLLLWNFSVLLAQNGHWRTGYWHSTLLTYSAGKLPFIKKKMKWGGTG